MRALRASSGRRDNSVHGFAAVAISASLAAFTSPLAAASPDPIPVPRVTIYQGDVILAGLLEDGAPAADRDGRERYLTDRRQIIGKIARRTLLPGRGVPANAVREPDIVRSGKPVTVIYQAGGLSIFASAIALQSGVTGDTVSAQTLDNGAVIRGQVNVDGTIRVGENELRQ